MAATSTARRRAPVWVLVAGVALAALPAVCVAGAETWQGVSNGNFEEGLHAGGERPAQWLVGFPDDPEPLPGSWRLVHDPGRGGRVLEVSCESDQRACLVAQVADLPVRSMTGRRLRFHVRIDVAGAALAAGVQLAAINPEVAPDPVTGISEVGFLQLAPSGAGWQDLDGEVVLDGVAEYAVVVLYVIGDGAVVRFDDVRLTADMPRPSCAPWVDPVEPLAGGLPPFRLGLVNENPRTASDRGRTALVARAAEAADIVNLFAHVRWNGLGGLPLLDGHEAVVDEAARARELGLERMLTLDFTHASLDGLGDINPMPDGTPVDRLDADSRTAYLGELEALVEATGATIVSVGIETNFFWQRHPEQWTDFRAMVCEASDRLHAVDPQIHVTTYFTLDGLAAWDLTPNVAGQQAMRALIPCIDSVGFSLYPADGTLHAGDLPDGLMTAAASVAPELPLIVPEFGFRSDGPYSESEQERFLRWALADLATHPTVAAIWYSLHDQTYLGAAPFFQEAFRHIGLIGFDGTPKRAWEMLRRTRAGSEDGAAPAEPRPWCRPPPRSSSVRVAP